MVPVPPIYERVTIGSMRSNDGEQFDIVIGLDNPLVRQLIERSLDITDEDLQNNTSDMKRFGEGSYDAWFSKGRVPYALVNADGKLAALAWFGPKPLGRKSLRYLTETELQEEYTQIPSDEHTVVYRSYRPYRGKGLMGEFMRHVIADYKARYPEAKLWVGISERNVASVRLASKFGFVRSDEHSDPSKEWIAMIEQ